MSVGGEVSCLNGSLVDVSHALAGFETHRGIRMTETNGPDSVRADLPNLRLLAPMPRPVRSYRLAFHRGHYTVVLRHRTTHGNGDPHTGLCLSATCNVGLVLPYVDLQRRQSHLADRG
jgi:hypothetical protein